MDIFTGQNDYINIKYNLYIEESQFIEIETWNDLNFYQLLFPTLFC